MFVTTTIINIDSVFASCDITKQIYRDVDGKGFELRFNNPPSNSALHFATVVLYHPKRNNIGVFKVGTSQGFGTIYLEPQTESENNITAYFFDSQLKSVENYNLGEFLFISGLGSWDWYDNQMNNSREIVLGNSMWKFDRCQ